MTNQQSCGKGAGCHPPGQYSCVWAILTLIQSPLFLAVVSVLGAAS